MSVLMNDRRFKINKSVAWVVAAIAWIASLACGWLLVPNGAGGRIIELSLLTVGSALSILLWCKSRPGGQLLQGTLLNARQECRRGMVGKGVLNIGEQEQALQQLVWTSKGLMEQVKTTQAEMHEMLAYLAYGIRPEGGFSLSLKQLSAVTEALAVIADLMNATAEGGFNEEVAVSHDILAMQTLLGDVGKVLDGIIQDDSPLAVIGDGGCDPDKLQRTINLSLDALDVLNNIAIALIVSSLSKSDRIETLV